MLNRLHKTNEYCRIKPRMHKDRVIYVVNDQLKFVSNFQKVNKEDRYASESEVLAFFAVEHAEIGRVIGYYEGQKTCDREYYMLSELYFAYWAL